MSSEQTEGFRTELDARFPADKGNLDQQIRRSSYFNARMAGRPVVEAERIALDSVLRSSPGITAVDNES